MPPTARARRGARLLAGGGGHEPVLIPGFAVTTVDTNGVGTRYLVTHRPTTITRRGYAGTVHVHVTVRLDPATAGRPDPGSTVRVELRDTGLADAPSQLIAAGEATLSTGDTTTVDLDVDESALPARARLQLSARAAPEQEVPRARGDWITMESFPWTVGDDSAQVRLRPIP